jgi:hypothetical protein
VQELDMDDVRKQIADQSKDSANQG